MSLEKSSIVWTAKQIRGMVANGKISFDNIVQRSYVWEKSRKSGLIESLILGYPVPVIYAKRSEMEESTGKSNKMYDVLDGKQRLSTIKEYLSDEFALTAIPEVTYYDEEDDSSKELDITGCKFSELPDAIKDHLLSTTFNVTYFDNLTHDEERELFKRLNSGKPLSTKSRLLASCKDIHEIMEIGSHKMLDEMLTAKAKENKNQVSMVMKAWCMLNMDIDDVSFAGKDFNQVVEETEITDAEKLHMNKVFDLIADVHAELAECGEKKVAKKLYTETHMVSLIPYFDKALEMDIESSLIGNWLISFFGVEGKASVSDEYNIAAGNCVAKSFNIVNRHKALGKSFDEFFEA